MRRYTIAAFAGLLLTRLVTAGEPASAFSVAAWRPYRDGGHPPEVAVVGEHLRITCRNCVFGWGNLYHPVRWALAEDSPWTVDALRATALFLRCAPGAAAYWQKQVEAMALDPERLSLR